MNNNFYLSFQFNNNMNNDQNNNIFIFYMMCYNNNLELIMVMEIS